MKRTRKDREFTVPFRVDWIEAVGSKVICLSRNGQFAVFDPADGLTQFQMAVEVCGEVRVEGDLYALPRGQDFKFCSLKKIASGSPLINLGTVVQLWNWDAAKAFV